MEKTIFIRKKPEKPLDTVRIKNYLDIPKHLSNNVFIEGNFLYLLCVEGTIKCHLGSVIGFEKSDKLQTGWNCWVINKDEQNLIEKDNLYFAMPTILKAEKLSRTHPAYIPADMARMVDESTWILLTPTGHVLGKINEDYWTLNTSTKGSTAEINILLKTDISYKEYVVCSEKGSPINLLHKIDPA